MASPKQTILNQVASAFENISTGNSYNTKIQKVVKGKMVHSDKVPPAWRQCYVCLVFSGQSNDAGVRDHFNTAIVDIAVYACMSNVTSDTFMLFLDDLESSIHKDGILENSSESFNILDRSVASINIVDSQELDEMLSPTDEQYKDREAVISISVSYLYSPKFLSGN